MLRTPSVWSFLPHFTVVYQRCHPCGAKTSSAQSKKNRIFKFVSYPILPTGGQWNFFTQGTLLQPIHCSNALKILLKLYMYSGFPLAQNDLCRAVLDGSVNNCALIKMQPFSWIQNTLATPSHTIRPCWSLPGNIWLNLSPGCLHLKADTLSGRPTWQTMYREHGLNLDRAAFASLVQLLGMYASSYISVHRPIADRLEKRLKTVFFDRAYCRSLHGSWTFPRVIHWLIHIPSIRYRLMQLFKNLLTMKYRISSHFYPIVLFLCLFCSE